MTNDNMLVQFTEAMSLIYREKFEARKQFNPNNEPIILMRVIEKKTHKRLRPWIGMYKLNTEKTRETGYKQYDKVPPTPQETPRNDSHYKLSGRLDSVKYVDPDMINDETDLPMWRTFKHGEIFLAVKSNAIWMEHQEYALSVPNWKNVPDEKTGEVRFAWAEENEVISDENAVLIPKYHERYSKDATSVMSLAERLLEVEMKLKDYQEKDNDSRRR